MMISDSGLLFWATLYFTHKQSHNTLPYATCHSKLGSLKELIALEWTKSCK